MTSKDERFLLGAKITRLQMQHEDINEMRNALLLAMVFVPFAILAIPSQLNPIGNNGAAFVVIIGAVAIYGKLEDKVIEYGVKLKNIHAMMDALLEQIELGLKKG